MILHSVVLIKERSPDIYHHVYEPAFYTQPRWVVNEDENEITISYDSKTMKGLRATFNKKYIER